MPMVVQMMEQMSPSFRQTIAEQAVSNSIRKMNKIHEVSLQKALKTGEGAAKFKFSRV